MGEIIKEVGDNVNSNGKLAIVLQVKITGKEQLLNKNIKKQST